MARLPVPGSDDNSWGTILNDYLSQAHDAAGNLKANSVPEMALDGAVRTKLNATPTHTNTLANAVAGTTFRCLWSGSAWQYNGVNMTTRPSARTDIFFELVGAPAATADPAWMINGDSRLDT